MKNKLCPFKFISGAPGYYASHLCEGEDCMLYVKHTGQCALASNAILKANQLEKEEIRRSLHNERRRY